MDDYARYDAVGLAEAIARGDATADEALAAAQARAKAVNPAIRAVVVDVAPPVRRDSDGPFAGVPFLIKDLGQPLAGWPMSKGSRAWSRALSTQNGTVVDRWLDAGLVIFGKTNTPEFGAKGQTEPHLWGPTRNPWDVERTPGGSSGGSAAAVAAGIVPCAGGNDGGGSIRIPASACGLVGLKVSRGRVPQTPESGDEMLGSAVNGVLSRSVRDTAAMLDVMSGPAPDSPYEGPAPTPLLPATQREPGRLRIGLATASAINPSVHPEAIAAARTTGDLLRRLGHEVVELERMPFDDRALAKDFLTTWFAWCAWFVDDARRRTGATLADFEPDTLVMAGLGRATKPVELVAAIEGRHGYVQSLARFHQEFDLLLTPTTATPPPRIGEFDQPDRIERVKRALIAARSAGALRYTPIVQQMITENLGWVPYTQLANLTGRPAISLPLHWTPDGLPIGSQFVGPLGSEPLLISLAAQLEAAQPWADRRPPL